MDVNHVVCKHIYENIMIHLINNFNMNHYFIFVSYVTRKCGYLHL